jgi:hypothetical protein
MAHPRPLRDDKVLTAWNGLMIAAFARAARVLRSERLGGSPDTAQRHLESALAAARFVRDHLWRPDQQVLMRRYRDGDVAVEGYAEDYANIIFGALELAQAGGGHEWIAFARTLQARQDALFYDEAAGGWFSTTGTDRSVLLRLKDDYDGAEPTASSMSVLNLLTLVHLEPSQTWEQRIERTLACFADRLGTQGRVVPMMSCALAAYHAGLAQVVMAGAPDAADTAALLDVLGMRYLPFTVVLPPDPDGTAVSFAAAMPPIDGHAAAYVCRDFTCRAPVTTPEGLAAALTREP